MSPTLVDPGEGSAIGLWGDASRTSEAIHSPGRGGDVTIFECRSDFDEEKALASASKKPDLGESRPSPLSTHRGPRGTSRGLFMPGGVMVYQWISLLARRPDRAVEYVLHGEPTPIP